MKNRVSFGMAEAVVLLTISSMARIFMPFPRTLVELAGPAAWLSSMAGLSLALLQVLLFYFLLKPHPDKNLMDITGRALGKVAGAGVNIFYAIFFMLISAEFTRTFSETLILSTLPRTPISVVMTSFILMAVMGAYLGLETMARSARLTYPFVLVGISLIFFGLIPLWDFTNLFPILGTGPVDVFIKGGFFSSAITEILLAAVIVQSFKGQHMYGKIVSRAMIMGFVYLILLELIFIMTVNWNVAQESTLPFYQLSRLIYLGRFFQRVESIFIILWGFIAIIKIALSLYASAYVLAETFSLPDYRPLIMALAVIGYSISIIPPDLPASIQFDKFIRDFAFLPTVILPAVVLAVDRFRMRGA